MEKCVPGWCFSCLDLLQGSLGEIPYQPAECFRISWRHYQCSLLASVEKKIKNMARIGNWKIVGYLWLRQGKGSIWMHRNFLRPSALCSWSSSLARCQASMYWQAFDSENEQQVPCRESGQNLSTLTKRDYCGLGCSHVLHDFTANHASPGRLFVFIFCHICRSIVSGGVVRKFAGLLGGGTRIDIWHLTLTSKALAGVLYVANLRKVYGLF